MEEEEEKVPVQSKKRGKKKKKKVSASNSVQVAVRVRPLNYKEKKRNEGVCVDMQDNTTIIFDPETGKENRYTYDFSYWSIKDEKKEFATQETVYDDLGKAIVRNAFEGYNSCVFAYGQTGSGKSYSTFGTDSRPGIVPRLCHDLFDTLQVRAQNPETNVKSHRVEVSMIEIYNEKVRDLFHPDNPRNEVGLKVRENPRTGPYVMGLTMNVAKNYKELKTMLDEGSQLRTIGSTSMNDRSSRAHTIFQIVFTQIFQWTSDKAPSTGSSRVKKKSQRVSKINIIDLAGSERQGKAKTEGKRLKEGSAINLSLSMLGNVINKLAERSKNPKAKPSEIFVPYRNSTLTWLLKESLGGNAKTVMLATISPASYNYPETLSTLRYANRAKQIQNHAVVNEDSQSKLINDLKSEVKRLKQLLDDSQSPMKKKNSKNNIKQEEEEEEEDPKLLQMLLENQSIITQLQKSEEERDEESQRIADTRKRMLREAGVSEDFSRKEVAHMVNLNEDPSLNENLLYFFKPGEITKIGALKGINDIVLQQPAVPPSPKKSKSVEEEDEGENEMNDNNNNNEEEDEIFYRISGEHCLVHNDVENNEVTITPCDHLTCIIYVNSKRIESKTVLKSGDRIILGRNKVFRFHNPSASSSWSSDSSKKVVVNWDELKTSMENDMKKDLEQKLRTRELEISKVKKKRKLEEAKIDELKKEVFEQEEKKKEELKNEQLTTDKSEEIQNYNKMKLDLEADIKNFESQVRDEQGEKRILEDEKRFLEETLDELRKNLMKSKMELEYERVEKEGLVSSYEKEKKGLEGHTNQLQKTMTILTNELREVEQETKKHHDLRVEQKSKLTDLKEKVEDFDVRLKEEIHNKEMLKKETIKLEKSSEVWKKRHIKTKQLLEVKTKEEHQLFPILQQIIYAQNEKVRKNLDRLQQQLSQEMMEMETEKGEFNEKIRELSKTGVEKQGEFVAKLIQKTDTVRKEVKELKEEVMAIEIDEISDDEEEGEDKKGEEEYVEKLKFKLDKLESEKEILKMENMRMDTIAKERLEVINQLRKYLK